MRIHISPTKIEDYRIFLKVKSLPRFRFIGRTAEIPDEYASRLGLSVDTASTVAYEPSSFLFDYQAAISRIAIAKQKYALFIQPGLGKTLCYFEWMRHVDKVLPKGKCVLFLCPLMVVKQTMSEAQKFYGDSLPLRRVRASELAEWLTRGTERFGIANYEALSDEVPQGRLGALVCDESSIMKSHYGVWGQHILRLGRGLDWKLAGTGTPAPNDRIEYANHAVFLDRYPTVNSFLARFFVNRGQTDNRWEIKPHALRPFYRSLSDWCIFLNNPSTYGWKDNVESIPPVHVHIHEVPLSDRQRELAMENTGKLFAGDLGGIVGRSKLGQIAKGNYKGEEINTYKPPYIRGLVESWPDESTIIWCIYNKEQESIEKLFPDCASIDGSTPENVREKLVEDFQQGRRRVLISKAKVLGLGLNLQIATRQVFSGLQDSYEMYFQCVKRANRIGSTLPLNVHIPISEIERPMVDTVLRKAHRIELDTTEQEALFAEIARAA
jgi:hypothetical protein